MDEVIAKTAGHYREILGRSRMATIYKGTDVRFERPVVDTPGYDIDSVDLQGGWRNEQ